MIVLWKNVEQIEDSGTTSLVSVLLWLSAGKENHQKKLGKAHFVCTEIKHGCQDIVLPREARQQFASLWYVYIFCIENSIHHQFQVSIVLLKLLHHIIYCDLDLLFSIDLTTNVLWLCDVYDMQNAKIPSWWEYFLC
jgi:hypothetical protein